MAMTTPACGSRGLAVLLPFLLLLLPVSTLAGNGCDEARCRGTRIHPWVDNDVELTCWIPLSQVENVTHPSYCADGWVGHFIPEVPTEVIDGEERGWYTCCPPDWEGVARQTCTYSDCASPDWAAGGNCWADGFQEPMSCGSSKFRFPHYSSQKSLIYFQFLCCDSQPSTSDNAVTRELVIARSIWMVFAFITFAVASLFMTALVTSPTALKEGWNMYLLFLAFPDALANLIILIRNSLTIPGVPVSPTLHVFFAAFEYFYAAANLWLNGVIIYQIHHTLRQSGINKATIPAPTVQAARKQSLIVYGLAAVVFCWAFYLYYRALLDFSLDATIDIWISTRCLLIIPVFVYICYVCVDVYRRDLLPKSGRTRVLSLYFLRVIVVFLFTWIPYFILYEVAWNITYSSVSVYVSYYLTAIQGTASVLVALGKPDVNKAFLRLFAPILGPLGCMAAKKSKKSHKKKPQNHGELTRAGTGSTAEAVSVSPSEAATSSTGDYNDPNNEWFQVDDWGAFDIDDVVGTADADPEQALPIVPRAVPSKTKRGGKKVTMADDDDGIDGNKAEEGAVEPDNTDDSKDSKESYEHKDGETFESRIERIRRERDERMSRMAKDMKSGNSQGEEEAAESFKDEESKDEEQPKDEQAKDDGEASS